MWHRRVGVGVDDGAGLLRVCCVNGARAAHALLSGALQGAHQHAKHFAVALLTPSPPLPSSPLPSPPLPSSPHALSSRPCAHASRGVRERAGAPAAHRGTHVPRSSLEAQHRPLSSQAMHASILQLLRPPRQHCLRRARGEAGSRSCQGLPPSQVSRPPPRRPRRSSAAADIRWVETSTRSTERAAWNDGKTCCRPEDISDPTSPLLIAAPLLFAVRSRSALLSSHPPPPLSLHGTRTCRCRF